MVEQKFVSEKDFYTGLGIVLLPVSFAAGFLLEKTGVSWIIARFAESIPVLTILNGVLIGRRASK